MARGNRRENIVHDDADREMLLATLAQACQRTGWEVLAWVLMDNHYHWLLRTPKPNLVAGMSWFQSTFTQRYNAKHRVWGHLFGERYKAIPVQGASQRTPVTRIRTAQRLSMKSAVNVKQQIKRMKTGKLIASKEAKQWLSTIAP